MTVQEFADTTFRVVAKDGFANHIPTVLFPERHHLAALESIPEGVNIEEASRSWAQEIAVGTEEYLVVFKIDRLHFKIVRRFNGAFEEGVFEVQSA